MSSRRTQVLYNYAMDTKFLRLLIYLFSGLIVVFALLMLVNYLGSYAGSRIVLPGQEAAGDKKEINPEAFARQAIAAAKYGAGARNPVFPGGGANFSTGPVNSGGAIMLVKVKDFSGVAESPKGMMDLLNDMGGGGRNKKPVIALGEADLDKKISVPSAPEKGPRRGASPMPELGRSSGQEGVTLLSAPVDYKIFKSSETWWAFANSRKFRPEAQDFSSADLLILVSVSDFPSGIFKITGVETGKKETVVKYRVDPLAMGQDTPKEQREAYAAAPVPKKLPIRLQQVP